MMNIRVFNSSRFGQAGIGLFAFGLAVVMLLAGAASVRADVIAYEIPEPVPGNQDFGNGLGHDFVVNSEITITALGVFDADADGIADGTTLGTQIWERNDGGTPDDPVDDSAGAMLASMTFDFGAPGNLVGSQRFKLLAEPLVLPPGSYTVNSDGYNGNDNNGNDGGVGNFPTTTNDGGGAITFVGSSRFGSGINQWPATPDGGPEARYGGPTFEFVPEPSTLILSVIVASVSLLYYRRGR